MRGRLVVIDGLDASGKNTQAKLLKENLVERGFKAEILSFPVYDSFFGKLISDYLNGAFGDKSEIDPRLVSLLYALDRFLQKQNLEGLIEKGYVVICDRYVDSNIAYQAAKLQDPKARSRLIEWIQRLEYEQLSLPRPDLTFFLHVPLEISKSLMRTRQGKSYLKNGLRDIHERDESYLAEVEKIYLALCSKPTWRKIVCSEKEAILPKEKILRELLSHLEEFLRKS